VDAYLPALAHVRRAGVDAVGGNLLSLPFADAQFAVVGCFDVLYHRRVSDLARALDELHRVCRPGGLLLITDSASPRLSSNHDVAMHGARRFRLADLHGRVQSAGFDVLHESYYHTLLFPVAAGIRLTRRAIWGAPRADTQPHGRSDLSAAPAWLNASLNRLYALEARLVRRHRLPFGLSLIIAAGRPSTSASESRR
jgi:SAM-dependent methyltransferase